MIDSLNKDKVYYEGLLQKYNAEVKVKRYFITTYQTGSGLTKGYYGDQIIYGVNISGWIKADSYWYYYDSNGKRKTGWLNTGGKWYYLNNPNGDMSSNKWQWIDGKCYYFYSDGSMATNTIIDGYYVGSNGVWIP